MAPLILLSSAVERLTVNQLVPGSIPGGGVVVDNNNRDHWKFGGRPVTPTHLLLLLGEMEGVYQHLKYMGFKEDMDTIEEMKKRYYKMYFKLNKESKK